MPCNSLQPWVLEGTIAPEKGRVESNIRFTRGTWLSFDAGMSGRLSANGLSFVIRCGRGVHNKMFDRTVNRWYPHTYAVWGKLRKYTQRHAHTHTHMHAHTSGAKRNPGMGEWKPERDLCFVFAVVGCCCCLLCCCVCVGRCLSVAHNQSTKLCLLLFRGVLCLQSSGVGGCLVAVWCPLTACCACGLQFVVWVAFLFCSVCPFPSLHLWCRMLCLIWALSQLQWK